MYFRFASAICLVVVISLIGVGLEKETLSLHREVSRQHFRTDILGENRDKLRWECEQLGAPQRLIEQLPVESNERRSGTASTEKSPHAAFGRNRSEKQTTQLKTLPLLDMAAENSRVE